MAKRTAKNSSNAQRSSAPRSSSQNRSRASQQRRREAYKKRQRQKWLIRIITLVIAVALIVTLVLSVASCNRNKKNAIPGSAYTDDVNGTAEDGNAGTDDTSNTDGHVTLTAVGDIIAHETILDLANTGNGYDFTSLFSLLKEDISAMWRHLWEAVPMPAIQTSTHRMRWD